MELTSGQRGALENLACKSRGEAVGWINIADARTLADAGLCDRDRQGWRINARGAAWLIAAGAEPTRPASASDEVITFRR